LLWGERPQDHGITSGKEPNFFNTSTKYTEKQQQHQQQQPIIASETRQQTAMVNLAHFRTLSRPRWTHG